MQILNNDGELVQIRTRKLQVDIRPTDGGLVMSAGVIVGSRTVNILESYGVHCGAGTTRLIAYDSVSIKEESHDTVLIELSGCADDTMVTSFFQLNEFDPLIHCNVHVHGRGGGYHEVMSHHEFVPGVCDYCFTPHLRPGANDVVGRFAMKSPVCIMQKDAHLACLVADVTDLDDEPDKMICLDANVKGSTGASSQIAVGIANHEPYGLIYFRKVHSPAPSATNREVRYSYYMLLSADAVPASGYSLVVRSLWRMFGRKNFMRVDPQTMSRQRYTELALNYAVKNLWRDFPSQEWQGDGDARSTGGLIMGIKYPNDIWFHFFFNQLHTAYGLLLYGRENGDADLVEKARRIKQLALQAPSKAGLQAAVFTHEIVTGLRRERWVIQSHWASGAIPYADQATISPDFDAYSTLDSSWTAYWMLRWLDTEPDDGLLDRVTLLGDTLLAVQRPSGAIPTFLHASNLAPMTHLQESPDCAVCGLFLAELFSRTGQSKYLLAAERVASFIEDDIMPQKWACYETYYDSAAKPLDTYDGHTNQLPQNTYPMYWSSQLFKSLYRTTARSNYLASAVACVDYLLLFQAVWSPPYLGVKGFGSVGIGNGHTGWNDARSGIFASGIADFFPLTGNREYLERGVAAARAPLVLMYAPENERVASTYNCGPIGYADECYAHRGKDGRLGPSCFDYSVGYALVAFHELCRRYGSIYLHTEGGWAVGIDGVAVTDIHSTERDGFLIDISRNTVSVESMTVRLDSDISSNIYIRDRDAVFRLRQITAKTYAAGKRVDYSPPATKSIAEREQRN